MKSLAELFSSSYQNGHLIMKQLPAPPGSATSGAPREECVHRWWLALAPHDYTYPTRGDNVQSVASECRAYNPSEQTRNTSSSQLSGRVQLVPGNLNQLFIALL